METIFNSYVSLENDSNYLNVFFFCCCILWVFLMTILRWLMKYNDILLQNITLISILNMNYKKIDLIEKSIWHLFIYYFTYKWQFISKKCRQMNCYFHNPVTSYYILSSHQRKCRYIPLHNQLYRCLAEIAFVWKKFFGDFSNCEDVNLT